MSPGNTAALSPNEEITLRRVALAVAGGYDLRQSDVARLVRLHLVEERGGELILTDTGRQRYKALPGAADTSGNADLREVAALLKRDLRKCRG